MAKYISALILLVTYICSTSAFFLNWGTPDERPIQPPQQQQWPVTAYYQQRVLQQPQYASGENGVPVQIPAIPIQVPLQAQMSPAASIQNVQLVPCLCPVAQDYEFDKNVESPNSVFVSQIKPQKHQ